MANPNPEIWGAPETWINAKHFNFVGDGDPDTRTSKPKTADFGNISGTLAQGDLVGKTPINNPIDGTICPCGQNPLVSCFGSIALFKNKQDAAENIIPDNVITSTVPCNWFMYDGTGISGLAYGHKRDWTDTSTIWYPDATTAGNWNMYVTPFTYWQLNSVLISIEVATFTGYNFSPSIQWKTLKDWKDNFSDRKICEVRLTVRGVSQQTDTTITYQSNTEMADGDMFGFANMDYFGSLIDYASYCTNSTLGCRYYMFGIQQRGNYYDVDSTVILNAYDMFDGQEVKTYSTVDTGHGWLLWYEIPYSDDTYEKIMKMTACFGCVFTNTDRLTIKKDMSNDDVYIPVIDDDGICHGDYTHGAGNVENDLYNADSIREKTYDPSKYDPNTYSDTTTFNDVNFINAFTRRYLLNSTQVSELATELWNANATKDPADTMSDFALDEYLTNNPIDTIVSLKYFPCTFSDVAPSVVYLGKYQTNIAATGLGTSVRIVDFDPINVYRHFGDFRDFEPYTQISVYIPFCGTVTVPTAECMGKYVSVKLAIDTATGAATGFVIVSQSGVGGICVATATGTAAIDIPVSGLQSANLQQAIFNATANWTQTQISNAKITSGIMQAIGGKLGSIAKGFGKNTPSIAGAISAVKGGPLGLGAYAANTLNPIKAMYSGMETEVENAKSEYALQHIEMPMRLIGSASPTLATVIELQCRLIIYRPVTDDSALSSYADTVGYACLKSGTVSQFSGYTEGTIDVRGINATHEEKAAIAASFASGVYL
ncbi:MAG: hypothetical protein J6R52_02870 [Alphaproteobacteria bacterium]|nr:hypothetical protein [Alphaproteobacteria bacterium]